MKRSSSKLISKAGSVRNINKLAYKFSFELHVESVDKMIGVSDVVVTWERGPKLLSTKPTKIDKSSRVAHFGGEVLSQEITLFKKKKEGSKFEDKVFRLTARQNSARGKVIGKIDLDYSDYVEIPSYSKRIGATLSSGGRIVMRIMSNYLGEAKPRRSSHGTASLGSRDPESDGQSSLAPDEDESSEMDADLHDLNEYDDIDIDNLTLNVPPPQPTPQPNIKKTSSNRNRPPTPAVPEEPAGGGRFRRKPSASPKGGSMAMDSSAGSSGNLRRFRSKGAEVDVGATNAAGPSRAEFEKLRRENRALRRQNDDLQQDKDLLERRIDEGRHDESAESLEQLMVANTELRRDVGDLEAKLAREPVYADVVRELREAKMALAILTLEKDELLQEVRKLRKR